MSMLVPALFISLLLALAPRDATAATAAAATAVRLRRVSTNSSTPYVELPLALTLPAGARMRKSGLFAIDHCESGYTQLSRVSLTVSRGISGSVTYKVSTRGVHSTYLAKHDKRFRAALDRRQRKRYNGMRWRYSGGLDVPFLRMVGVDLSRPRVGRADMVAAARKQHNYWKLSREARRVVNEMSDHDVSIKGTLKATGVTTKPVTVFAFLRVAKVSRDDGSSLMVLSDRAADRIGVSDAGSVMPGDIKHGPLWWQWKPERCSF